MTTQSDLKRYVSKIPILSSLRQPLGSARKEFGDEGLRRELMCTRCFLYSTGLVPSHKSGTGDHKTVVFATRVCGSISRCRLLGVSRSSEHSRRGFWRPLQLSPLGSSYVGRTMGYVRHCDILVDSKNTEEHSSSRNYFGYLQLKPGTPHLRNF